MKIEKKTWGEYWSYWMRVTYRHSIPGIFEKDKELVELVIKECDLSAHARILDLGCGDGYKAGMFAKKGHKVTAIDKSESLIKYAKKEMHLLPKVEYILGDMFNIDYKDEFDLCVMLDPLLGYSSDDDNIDMLDKIWISLKPEGKAFIQYTPLEYWADKERYQQWDEIEGGFSLEEHWFDKETSTYRSTYKHVLGDRIIIPADEEGYHANQVVRCYGNREVINLVEYIGFTIINHYDELNKGTLILKKEK